MRKTDQINNSTKEIQKLNKIISDSNDKNASQSKIDLAIHKELITFLKKKK